MEFIFATNLKIYLAFYAISSGLLDLRAVLFVVNTLPFFHIEGKIHISLCFFEEKVTFNWCDIRYGVDSWNPTLDLLFSSQKNLCLSPFPPPFPFLFPFPLPQPTLNP
jgi:hypothetical protein